MDDAQLLERCLCRIRRDDVPERLYTGAGLLQGLQDGQLQALKVLKELQARPYRHKFVCSSVTVVLVRHVLGQSSGSRQQQDQQEQSEQGHTPAAVDTGGSEGKDSSSSSWHEWWCRAVGALASVWADSCHVLDTATVLDVLQCVLQGWLQLQLSPSGRRPSYAGWKLMFDVVHMLEALRPHAPLATAVLQDSGFVRQLTAAVAATGECDLAVALGSLVAASGVPVRELPAAYTAVCELLASGRLHGSRLLWRLLSLAAYEAGGVWPDPLLLAACLEGARKAAAALEGVVASKGGQSAGSGSSGGAQQQQQQQQEKEGVAGQGMPSDAGCAAADASGGGEQQAAAPFVVGLEAAAGAGTAACATGGDAGGGITDSAVTSAAAVATGSSKDSSRRLSEACSACGTYVQRVVCLVEVLQLAQQPASAAIARELVAAAWQCVKQLMEARCSLHPMSHHTAEAWSAAQQLLGSDVVCQVLLQQPGGVCSMEEVCGLLERGLKVSCCIHAVGAVKRLLKVPTLRTAALALPGFAAAVVTHVPWRVDSTSEMSDMVQRSIAPLLGLLALDPNGRAALLAEPDILGGIAWDAATCDAADVMSPHLEQLWAAGVEEGWLEEALLAGLSAVQEGWVRFFGWLVRRCSPEVWEGVPGLSDALAGAFNKHQPGASTSTLEQVLAWLLPQPEGRDLLSDGEEILAALSEWLQRHASPVRTSPLMALLDKEDDGDGEVDEDDEDVEDVITALAWLLPSPQLCKGALVSLVTCRDSFKQSSLAGSLTAEDEVQQQVLGDRDLLFVLLRAAAAAATPAHGQTGTVWEPDRNDAALCALQQLPRQQLLPVLLELLGQGPTSTPSLPAGGPPGDSSGQQPAAAAGAASGQMVVTAAAAAAGAGGVVLGGAPSSTIDSADMQVLSGAWVAVEQMRASSTEGRQQVLGALSQLVRDAGQVRALQQVEAAGHAAWVAAAQARQQLAAEQQQLQRDRVALARQQQALQREREVLAGQQQREREALQAERQQLEQLREEGGKQHKRRRRQL